MRSCLEGAPRSAAVRALTAGLALVASACARDLAPPEGPVGGALAGRAPPDLRPELLCTEWRRAVWYDRDASAHTSFPERAPQQACFVPVEHRGAEARPAPTPAGCGYPEDVGRTRAALLTRADRLSRLADGEPLAPPRELACPLPPGVRAAAARANARALRAIAASLDAPRAYPYGAIVIPGYGAGRQAASPLVGLGPEAACVPLAPAELERLDVNVERVRRGASALHGRVAPALIVSGGAVHSPLVEAFAMEHLARCVFGVPAGRVLVDPCADHTHTNLRNAGALVVALGARTAYLVTDGGLQSDYLSDFTLFDVIGGSVDQRSLRDFGALVGAWRRASVGLRGGFWFTPYRFWADGTGSCADDP